MLRNCAQFTEAEQLYRRALQLGEKVLSAEHPLIAKVLNELASNFHQQRIYKDVEKAYYIAMHDQMIDYEVGSNNI
jgi:hypothetical protein